MLAKTLLPLLLVATGAGAQDGPPFGREADLEDARKLWQAMAEERLVGAEAIRTMPYQGTPPHGAFLELLIRPVAVGDRSAMTIVKKNYAGQDLARGDVLARPGEHLASVTVMFRREDGYDPENGNWFWAKYGADGSLESNPAGVPLAGRVAKGMEEGCIACHAEAPGGDFVYSYDLPE
jgi:hypothetical protein